MADKKENRRKLLKSIAAGSGAIVAGKSLPESWSKPVVDSVLLPAHAETTSGSISGCVEDSSCAIAGCYGIQGIFTANKGSIRVTITAAGKVAVYVKGLPLEIIDGELSALTGSVCVADGESFTATGTGTADGPAGSGTFGVVATGKVGCGHDPIAVTIKVPQYEKSYGPYTVAHNAAPC